MNLDGGFIAMLKSAVDYTNRTGIDGLSLSPLQLEMRLRLLQEKEKRERVNMARAISAALTDDKEARRELLE